MQPYSKPYRIRFSDLDGNRHVNHAAYVDMAGDLRYQYFEENGFPPQRFEALGIGGVYTKLTTRFLREVRLGETVTVTFALAGLSPTGTFWTLQHEVLKANGKLAVSMVMEGTNLDMAARRPVAPDEELLRVFQSVPRTEEFEVLPERLRVR